MKRYQIQVQMPSGGWLNINEPYRYKGMALWQAGRLGRNVIYRIVDLNEQED